MIGNSNIGFFSQGGNPITVKSSLETDIEINSDPTMSNLSDNSFVSFISSGDPSAANFDLHFMSLITGNKTITIDASATYWDNASGDNRFNGRNCVDSFDASTCLIGMYDSSASYLGFASYDGSSVSEPSGAYVDTNDIGLTTVFKIDSSNALGIFYDSSGDKKTYAKLYSVNPSTGAVSENGSHLEIDGVSNGSPYASCVEDDNGNVVVCHSSNPPNGRITFLDCDTGTGMITLIKSTITTAARQLNDIVNIGGDNLYTVNSLKQAIISYDASGNIVEEDIGFLDAETSGIVNYVTGVHSIDSNNVIFGVGYSGLEVDFFSKNSHTSDTISQVAVRLNDNTVIDFDLGARNYSIKTSDMNFISIGSVSGYLYYYYIKAK